MTSPRPLIVALPLDQETEDILAEAMDLGRLLARPLVVVHALGDRALEHERGFEKRAERAREKLEPHLQRLRSAGLTVTEEIAAGPAADLVIRAVHRLGAELVVMGGGKPATVRRWLVGSVAEAVVRRATVPVWIARGGPLGGRPVLCPVDLTPQSRLGLRAGLRVARLFHAPLRVMTVVSDDGPLTADEAHEGVGALLASQDTEGVAVDVEVLNGTPAERIIDAAGYAGLLVVGSRGFDPLVPEWLGPITTRALRHAPCSLLAVREVDVDLERRQAAIGRLADAHRITRELIADGRAEEALPIIEPAAESAPANASIQEAYAIVLEKLGREVEARGRHEIAAMIRDRIGAR